MGGDVETIKERLDIAEVVGGYVKLEKAGQSLKARCPFHNEKTPSFFVSPLRQSYYCFGCGAKGDIFTFIQEVEGLSFREALKTLADKAGVEIEYRPEAAKERTEKDKIRAVLEAALQFFENQLEGNSAACKYLVSRGITRESQKTWQLGYAPAEWRSLHNYLLEKGYTKEILIKAGLIKPVAETNREPYDVFRDRLIFPLFDFASTVIGFSGRALSKDTEPKYLNSPDTILFTKSQVLHGLDIAKDKIRKKNYAVLVEGQFDLLLSHQAGVDNTVASSGTAFTRFHLERLKKLSPRIILAFDGDKAGKSAAEKSAELALALGLEVKIAKLPDGEDPASIAAKNPEEWKEILRKSLPAIEHFLREAMHQEKDRRKLGKLVEAKLLPLLTLLESSIERSHFVSLIAKHTGIKEEMIWDDLKKVKIARSFPPSAKGEVLEAEGVKSRKEKIEERLTEVRAWMKELKGNSDELGLLKKEEKELESHLSEELLKGELSGLSVELLAAETSKNERVIEKLTRKVQRVLGEIRALDEKRKAL